jgi:hypothetical protein
MEQRVLAELEEFWKQNVFAMLNTIFDPTGDEREVTSLQEALRGLVEGDWVLMGFEGFFPSDPERLTKPASLQLVSNLGGWFKFDSQGRRWSLSKGDIKKERIPMIFSTPAGRQKADGILTQRGYQWWRPKK